MVVAEKDIITEIEVNTSVAIEIIESGAYVV